MASGSFYSFFTIESRDSNYSIVQILDIYRFKSCIQQITRDYGYVVLAAAAPFVVNFWQMMKIGGLRKKHGIKYPVMTSDKHPDFNCAQRAHQNTLEQLPFYFPCVLLAGLRFPIYASIAGACFCTARIVYSVGYYTGNPEARVPGAIMSLLLGMLPLFGMAVSTGAGMLGWW